MSIGVEQHNIARLGLLTPLQRVPRPPQRKFFSQYRGQLRPAYLDAFALRPVLAGLGVIAVCICST